MNLLLLSESEAQERELVVTGRRAEHIHRVLKATPGQELKTGILGQGTATATILHVAATQVALALGPLSVVTQGPRKTLLLAAPRPKVLSRCLQHASALGFSEIRIFRSDRVDKSHLLSHKAQWVNQREHLLLGLEQSRRVHVPQVSLHPRFRPFVEDELADLLPGGPRFAAHPAAPSSTATLGRITGEYTLALGPEGGFVPFEIEKFQEVGFQALSAGAAPLRVESALSYVTGQLDLLAAADELGSRGSTGN